jgi:demethoxyubiquinone hydroxylase (CLK1/Coq7/Cat5 family)
MENMNKLGGMDEHYNEQIECTKTFYGELLVFIEQMRDDHLNDLYE